MLGTNIKNIRESKGISIDTMINKLGIFKKVYLNIEKNIKKPSNEILSKISLIFNVPINDIINYDNSKELNISKGLDIKNLKNIENTNIKKDLNPIKIGGSIILPIENPTISEIISQKPILLDKKSIIKFGNNLNLVASNLPASTKSSIDKIDSNIENNKIASPRLLNIVEPFKYKGEFKTLFYTEVNTGLKVGDKVFIINGNYDSNYLILQNKYKKGRDGYTVLFIDNCKIVLDIDYSGIKPYNESNVDDYINLYIVRNENEFQYFNKQITTRGGVYDFKFNSEQNNIVYIDRTYNPLYGSWGENGGASGPGFFVKNGTQSWIDITSNFISGSYSSALSLTYSNNNKLKIHNGSFTYSINSNVVEFNENNIYYWNNNTWENDVTYHKAIISKSNFRNGNFKGTWNYGIFGRQDKKISWEGEPAIWNLGTLLNSNWISGDILSNNTISNNSYIANISNNIAYQKLTGSNNNGNGYNFIFESNINSSKIYNGNIENTVFGYESGLTIVEDYILSNNSNYLFEVIGGNYVNCKFTNGYISNSNIVNSNIISSRLNNIKSVNSNYKKSVITNSVYLNDDNIKIINYDELAISADPIISDVSHKVYKFYISENDFNKLKLGDSFYIKGLNIKDNNKYPLNFFNKKFKLSTFTNYIDYFSGDLTSLPSGIINNSFYKRGINISAFLATPEENDWLYNSYNNSGIYSTIAIQTNPKKGYSIDIFVSIYDIEGIFIDKGNNSLLSEISNYGLNINNDIMSATPSNLSLTNVLRDVIDISNSYIINADFESGIFDNSDWIAGDSIRYGNDNNITTYTSNGGTYSIIVATSSSRLTILTNASYNQNLYNLESDNDFEQGNIVFINNLSYTSATGSIFNLPDTYKIINNDFKNTGELTLEEVKTNILSTLPDTNGVFSSINTYNRYNYIHTSKINNSKIKSGIFRRTYITNSFIDNDSLNIKDRLFNDISNIKNLLISDSIFKNTSNLLSKATYIACNFVNGNDTFINGIVYRSTWNGLTFSNGLFKESTWIDGIFTNGEFFNNRSFDGNATSIYLYYDTNRVNSYYKSGITTATISNNRYSWQNGTFSGGIFYKGDWENGNLNDGKFYFSKFYNGIVNGGIIGDLNLAVNDTILYNGTINYTTVNNAHFYASDTSYNGLSSSNITWNNGVFNDGLFSSNYTQSTNNYAIWNNGIFNGGEFSSMAKWLNGTFNGGKFISGYGWTMSDSPTQSNYSWQAGVFNGGIFGNEETGTNSTWYNGEFNDGKFTGRVWNNGLFFAGKFEGSSTYSAILGTESSNASLFTDSFSQSYYGLWRNGIVSDRKDSFINDKKFFTELQRSNSRLSEKTIELNNILWTSGTFSHNKAKLYNSVWLDGVFEKGKFISSSFNPFVKRNGSTQSSFNLNDATCYWLNGELINSDFYISRWKNGLFRVGNAYGMIWENGINEYMNAFNIFWENGLWRNGNWYGSYIQYNGTVSSSFDRQIIYRGMSWSGNTDCHLWNIFDNSSLTYSSVSNASAATPSNINNDLAGNDIGDFFLPG